MASKLKLDKILLKSLEPLSGLSVDKLDELAGKSLLEDLPPGRTLFRQGERDKRIMYVIAGQVELSVNDDKPILVKAKSLEARQPLANTQPRPSTAKTRGPATILTVDADLLEIIMDDSPLTGIEMEVTEISADDTTDWMLRFLQSRAFLKLPTQNIQAILMRMEELPGQKGDTILRQGETDDYYYIVQSGRCGVFRRPAPKAQDIQLASLSEGDGFGEEALITNGKRNASVVMLEDGVLMRLNKNEFLQYLAEPLITRIGEADVIAGIARGALLLDVRKHEEFNNNHIDGSVNIPLSMLRVKLDGLNAQREYILVCGDGNQSAAAAFLLTQHGFSCKILDGGLQAANIKLADPAAVASSATIPTSAGNKRSEAAEKHQQAAEDRARRLSDEANTARREAEQLARQTAHIEAAKREAEQQIARLQAEQQKQHEASVQAAQQQVDKELKRAQQAETRAHELKQQAEAARRQAEEELQKIEAARRANEQKQKALDDSVKRAQQIAAESAKAAEDAKRQAEKEAEEIRRQAHAEAEHLRREMEVTRRRFEEQASQSTAREAAARKQAEDVVRRTTEEARREAEEIRRQALAEAERLKAEAEHIRRAKLDNDQQQRFQSTTILETARQRAEELAEKTTRLAEQEADAIRRKALAEAEQLRAEMERSRQQIMEQAARFQTQSQNLQAEQQREQQRQAAAQQSHEQQAAEAARQEAERETRRKQAIRNAQMKKKEQARHMAEEIKLKLEQAEHQRQEQEQLQHGEGLSLARATIKHKDGKIILEGEHDIFIFKEPSVTPEQIEAELAQETRAKPAAGAKPELPAFEIKEQTRPVFRPANTQAVQFQLEQKASVQQQHRKKRHVLALAASVMLMLGGAGAYVFMHPELVGDTLLAKTDGGLKTEAALTQRTAANPANTNTAETQEQENNLRAEARARFDALLKEWQEITSR